MSQETSVLGKFPMLTAVAAPRFEVKLGHEPIQARSINLSSEDNQPVARVVASLNIGGGDYFAPITIVRERGEASEPMFTGNVDSALLTETDEIVVQATGMADFKEFGLSPLVHFRMPALDLIYMLARTSGLPENRIQIDVGEPLPLEAFEVIFPVLGCTVTRAVLLTSSVRLLPPDVRLLARFPDAPGREELRTEMLSASAWAVTYVSSRRVFDAEELARAQVDAALALLTASLRNGSTNRGDGSARPFSRARSRALPSLGGCVLVTGLLTTRAWLRSRALGLLPIEVDGADIPDLSSEAAQTRDLPAMLALWRAADEGNDALARLTALWESLEYFAASVEPTIVFSKAERKLLAAAIPDEFSGEKRSRITEVLQGLNSNPLMARISERARQEGSSLTRTDWDQLRKLRDARNDAVHGRTLADLAREDIAFGVSIAARLLVATRRRTSPDSLSGFAP